MILPYQPSPNTTQLRAKSYLLSLWYLQQGKVRVSEWPPGLPSCVEHRKELISAHPWTESQTSGLGSGKSLGGHQIEFLESVESTRFILCCGLHQETISCWGCITHDPHNWCTSTPSSWHTPIYTHGPHPVSSFPCAFLKTIVMKLSGAPGHRDLILIPISLGKIPAFMTFPEFRRAVSNTPMLVHVDIPHST